jgi:hypothetical protein
MVGRGRAGWEYRLVTQPTNGQMRVENLGQVDGNRAIDMAFRSKMSNPLIGLELDRRWVSEWSVVDVDDTRPPQQDVPGTLFLRQEITEIGYGRPGSDYRLMSTNPQGTVQADVLGPVDAEEAHAIMFQRRESNPDWQFRLHRRTITEWKEVAFMQRDPSGGLAPIQESEQ